MKHLSCSKAQTVALGAKYGSTLKGGDVVLLDGDLGAGKTAFTQGIAKALGIKEAVLSPTFTLMNVYEAHGVSLCHFDAYRLRSGEEAIFAGISEAIGDTDCICVIEWYKNIIDILPPNAKRVIFRNTGENTREIEFC